MAPTDWDIWSDYPKPEETVTLSVLLPNGLFLNIDVGKEATLLEVKIEVWDSAQHIPLFGLLQDMERYIWECVNGESGEREEQTDETRKLFEVRPFQAVLRLVERKSDKAEKALDDKIKFLVGKGLLEFESQMNVEVSAFRRHMRFFCENLIQSRKRVSDGSWREKLLQKYPIVIASGAPELPVYLASKLQCNKLVLSVRMEHATSESTCKLSVCPNIASSELLATVLEKKVHSAGLHSANPDEYVLKVCGFQEYIAGSHLLSQYAYIRECISCGKIPELLLVTACTIRDNEDGEDHSCLMARPRCVSETSTLQRKHKKIPEISSWTIDEPFSVKIEHIHRLNCDNKTKVVVKMGVFQGNELLCKTVCSNESAANDGSCILEEEIQFEDLNVNNIPRVAKLCICIYEISKTPKGARCKRISDNPEIYAVPIAWVNTTVFDFKGMFKSNLPISLYMWPYEDDDDCQGMLKPLGTVVTNPDQDQMPVLVIAFSKYHQSSPLTFPSLDQILDYATSLQNANGSSSGPPRASKSHLEQLRQICERDALCLLHEQEKELLWFLREDCCSQLPNSLPKLLTSLKWNERKEVVVMTALLQKWPRISAVKALELLDYAYADTEVRRFAVGCLRVMGDEELSLYSLQLVRALKHEAYLNSPLTEFLLERALTNVHFGHRFFWLLRSEMKFPDVSIRFGLILETFCRAAPRSLVGALSKQVEALNKLKTANDLVRNEAYSKKENKEKLKSVIQDLLSQNYYQNTFKGMSNPLDPRYVFRKLKVEKCKFLDSKMKPLWLAFENLDSCGKDVFILFKNGDDLRQDMLTLQMIRIMDRMWKEEGLDLRMIPYQCLATDHKVGLIEVVPNADTIANIQKERGFSATSAFKKGSLLAWLKEHNPTDQRLSKAIQEFTLSCAGYCVATYVLGVADRHSDNIMVKTNGQLFHIDFGHILGKFKEKFGIKRERVPFVLTHDFVYIITNGHSQKSQEFNKFQQCCEQAFLILRKKGPVVISLFAMMLSTGIPELNCEQDLNYLRETLVLDVNESEALKHFRSKFDDALRNSWKTSVNWFAHNIVKDNKGAE